jgi:hypothetical protein
VLDLTESSIVNLTDLFSASHFIVRHDHIIPVRALLQKGVSIVHTITIYEV